MRKKLSVDKEFVLLITGVAIIGFFIFKDFFLLKNVYIYSDIGSDTKNSYWPYLSYLSNMIYTKSFSFWSFNMGIGTNILSVNPVITDPFNLFAALWGPELIVYVLPYISLLKILIAAMGFYVFLKYIGINKFSALIVSLLYGFNGFVILWGQHYHLGTIIVLIPFVLLGFEKWMKEKKRYLYIFSLFLVAFSGYYFLFMFSIFFMLYAIVRYLEVNEFQFKHFACFILKIALNSLLAIGLSCFVLLPSVYIALNNPRVSGQYLGDGIFNFASTIEYLTMIFRLFSNDILGTGDQFYGVWNYYEAPMLYTGTLSILLVPLYFVYANKKNRIIYGVLFCCLFLFLLFPFFSQLFNAFSANAYRWTFNIIVFISILSAKSLNYITDNKVKINNAIIFYLMSIIVFVSITSLLIGNELLNWSQFFTHSFKHLFVSLVLLLLYCILLKFINRVSYKRLILIIVCIELAIFSSVSVNRSMLTKDFVESKAGYNDYTNEAIDYINNLDKDFFRVDKTYNSVFFADSLIQDYKGVESYNSLNETSYVGFLRDMEVPFKVMNHPNYLTGLDSNTTLSRLLGVKYLLVNNEAYTPKGYEFLHQIDNVQIYKDNYSLPLGFVYDKYISYEKFMNSSKEERNELILKSFVSQEKQNQNYEEINPSLSQSSKKISQVSIDEKNVVLINIEPISGGLNSRLDFNASSNDPQIIIQIPPINDETKKVKVSMIISSEVNSEGQIFWGGNNGFNEENSSQFYYGGGATYIERIIDYSHVNQLRIDTSNIAGEFTVSDFKIEVLENTALEDINTLKKTPLEVSKYSNGYIRGNILLDEPKMLFLSIPFDKGWRATVNGKRVNISEINIGFIGIDLPTGANLIELRYTPPLFIVGSIITVVLLLGGGLSGVFMKIWRRVKGNT